MSALRSCPRVVGLASTLALIACLGAGPRLPSPDRASDTQEILEETLACQIRQFATEQGRAAGAAVCIGIRDERQLADPKPALVSHLVARLGAGVVPRSVCPAVATLHLVAGPIDWLKDDEVRVAGSYSRGDRGETPLRYRVVKEADRWACAGPIISWDPL
jgi:hypothetical protein